MPSPPPSGQLCGESSHEAARKYRGAAGGVRGRRGCSGVEPRALGGSGTAASRHGRGGKRLRGAPARPGAGGGAGRRVGLSPGRGGRPGKGGPGRADANRGLGCTRRAASLRGTLRCAGPKMVPGNRCSPGSGRVPGATGRGVGSGGSGYGAGGRGAADPGRRAPRPAGCPASSGCPPHCLWPSSSSSSRCCCCCSSWAPGAVSRNLMRPNWLFT